MCIAQNNHEPSVFTVDQSVSKMATGITSPHKPRVLLCFSGSVATVKVPELVNRIRQFADIRLVPSGQRALHFLDRCPHYNAEQWQAFVSQGGLDLVVTDDDEWNSWSKLGDPVVHIELRRWADILLLAPASANTMAKAAAGIADSLMLSVIRAWDFEKPAILCPAMNTVMWNQRATSSSLSTLEFWGWSAVCPVVKTLACNENGNGALANLDDIIAKTKELLKNHKWSIEALSPCDLTFSVIGSRRFQNVLGIHRAKEQSEQEQPSKSPIILQLAAVVVFWLIAEVAQSRDVYGL